jgi:hypothetical protein
MGGLKKMPASHPALSTCPSLQFLAPIKPGRKDQGELHGHFFKAKNSNNFQCLALMKGHEGSKALFGLFWKKSHIWLSIS